MKKNRNELLKMEKGELINLSKEIIEKLENLSENKESIDKEIEENTHYIEEVIEVIETKKGKEDD